MVKNDYLSSRGTPTWLLSGVLLGLSVLGTLASNSLAGQTQTQSIADSIPQIPLNRAHKIAATGHSSLREGTYLYGESNKSNQLNQEYFVFEVQNNKVIGAAYMPRSSFDCFYGTQRSSRLNLTIVNSYKENTYSHLLNLNYYEPIANISRNDQQILEACKSTLLKQFQATGKN